MIKKIVFGVVITLVVGFLGVDYYKIRQEALCAHAATVRAGAHR